MMGMTPNEYRITVDTMLLFGTAIGCSRGIYEGVNRLLSIRNSETSSLTKKVSDFTEGAILTTFGAIGIVSCFQTGARYAGGIKILDSLDPMPKNGVFKHHAIQGLGDEKSCKAVILEGDLSSAISDIPMMLGDLIYEKCETRFYKLKYSVDFCTSLDEAKNYFGSEIDVVVIQAHASNQKMSFEAGKFVGNWDQVSCIKDALSSEGQLFLTGCNTATSYSHSKDPSITDRVSNYLPGVSVVGFSAYYNPHFTTSRFFEGRFYHDNHFPYNLNGYTSFFSAVEKKMKVHST